MLFNQANFKVECNEELCHFGNNNDSCDKEMATCIVKANSAFEIPDITCGWKIPSHGSQLYKSLAILYTVQKYSQLQKRVRSVRFHHIDLRRTLNKLWKDKGKK